MKKVGKKAAVGLLHGIGAIIMAVPFIAVTIGIIIGLFVGISYLLKDYKRQINDNEE